MSEEASCGAETAALVNDLVSCLRVVGANCDEAGGLAVEALRNCAELRLVRAPAAEEAHAVRSARQFVEDWMESRQSWLAVGPLGLVPSPELARELAASALRRGDRPSAAAWLERTAGVDSASLEREACDWAVRAADLTHVPLDLSGIAAVEAASLAWRGCASR